ncbi:REP-associated tyrosine transposase [Geomonas anaerohicana]|uniref:Transposase n=1 Tax=Geomonas anaerohicana TaxID=2798583 RepID=A0ABS0YGG8_9BACT|nr:transposase [Geomonas anaerohicana]MBJ6751024.1 transposase [Geomonas anaerohicana]
MRSRYKASDVSCPYFVTSTIVEWIPLFTSTRYCSIVTDSLCFCRERKGLQLHAYVIMDNHVHLIVTAPNATVFMRDFKSFTGKKIIEFLEADKKNWLLGRLEFFKKEYKTESQHQVWQEGFHPQVIFSEEMYRQKLDYVHSNPVRRGIISSPEHWVYSSASNYFQGAGIIDVDQSS